jgi:hypothetical protein
MKFEKEIRTLAGKIPCELCYAKSGTNLEEDGGCRHRPLVDSDLTDAEVLARLQRAVNFLITVNQSRFDK